MANAFKCDICGLYKEGKASSLGIIHIITEDMSAFYKGIEFQVKLKFDIPEKRINEKQKKKYISLGNMEICNNCLQEMRKSANKAILRNLLIDYCENELS